MKVDLSLYRTPQKAISYKSAATRPVINHIDSVSKLADVLDFGNNVYSSVGKLYNSQLHALKGMGIKRIIDLNDYRHYKHDVGRERLEYILCDLDNEEYGIFDHPLFEHHVEPFFQFGYDRFGARLDKLGAEKTNRMFVDDFVRLIGYIQEGNCFITRSFPGSSFCGGDELELLESCFNPKSIRLNSDYYYMANDWYDANILYNQFTEEDKKMMGWTPDFEKNLVAKLAEH